MRHLARSLALVVIALVLLGITPEADQRRIRIRSVSAALPPDPDPPSGAASDNENFDTLCARPDAHFCVDFRSSGDNEDYGWIAGSSSSAADASYDATKDMGLITWEEDEVSSEGLRVGLGNGQPSRTTGTRLDHPSSGTQKILIQLDLMWDTSWFTECKYRVSEVCAGYKWLQVTDNSIWTEPNLWNWGGQNAWSGETPRPLGNLNTRAYNNVVPPTDAVYPGNGTFCGEPNNENVLGPMMGDCFKFYPNRRTRIWMEFIHVAGETSGGDHYAHYSLWVADEEQPPHKISENLMQTCAAGYPGHDDFWIEYDTSYEFRNGGVMKAWHANLVVLKDYSVDPETLMEKPVGTPRMSSNFNAASSTFLHGQDSWTAWNVSGETYFTVQSTTKFEGAKAVEVGPLTTHPSIVKNIGASLTYGTVFAAIRKTHNSGSEAGVTLQTGGGSSAMFIRAGSDGNISIYNHATTSYVPITSYAADTWYVIQIEFNDVDQANTYRARVKTGTTWSSWSSWVTVNGGSYDNIAAVFISGEGDSGTPTHKAFFDSIYVYGGS